MGRGASLTHRLLAFSRRQTLNPQAVDVTRLIGDFQELLRHSLGPQIRCQLELDAELWLVDADPHSWKMPCSTWPSTAAMPCRRGVT